MRQRWIKVYSVQRLGEDPNNPDGLAKAIARFCAAPAFDEIGTSQRRNTEVRLTHRWRKEDSNPRSPRLG
jgi:hypothetical protein